MPEGPSIVILKELVQSFIGQQVLDVHGNSKKINLSLIKNKTILDFKSWGKHFLICLEDSTIRIHFLLFGSYRINEQKEVAPRLGLVFKNGALNFYACSILVLEQHPDKIYDWSSDVMNDLWDVKKAKEKLKKYPNMLVCDALLDQTIFAGVGNIIKNEVLFRIKVHPESTLGALPAKKINELIKEARNYSFEFLAWKKNYELKKHWLAHTKTICSRCTIPLLKKYLGKTNRRTFYCENCQCLYKTDSLMHITFE